MGGASSIPASATLSSDQTALVKLILPVYYSEELISEEEVTDAQHAWDKVLNDTSPAYLKAKEDSSSFCEEHPSCVTWFFTTFYLRLFDIHPDSRSMFSAGLKTQGKFLVSMITLALTLVLNPPKLEKVLLNLAIKHNERGVKAIEYGIVGEVLFYALRVVLGETTFTDRLYYVWTKIFSRMLAIMVPSALAWELQTHGAAQAERLLAFQTNMKRKIGEVSGDEATKTTATEADDK